MTFRKSKMFALRISLTDGSMQSIEPSFFEHNADSLYDDFLDLEVDEWCEVGPEF